MNRLFFILIYCLLSLLSYTQNNIEKKDTWLIQSSLVVGKPHLSAYSIESCNNGDIVILYKGHMMPPMRPERLKIGYKGTLPPWKRTYLDFDDKDIENDSLTNGLLLRYDAHGNYKWGKYLGRIDTKIAHYLQKVKEVYINRKLPTLLTEKYSKGDNFFF